MLRKKFAISRCVGVRLGSKSKFAVVVNAKKVMKNPLIQQNQGIKFGCGDLQPFSPKMLFNVLVMWK